MARHVLSQAVGLLKRHYGLLPEVGPPGEWATLVRVVLERGSPAKKLRDWSWIEEGPLGTPDEAVEQNGSRLAESLEAAGLGASHAGALCGLAKWWLRRIGDGEAEDIFQQRSLEAWQKELRAIRGVSWELADRILLFVGGLEVYPLDRGSLRIAARHGWMEFTAEYEDWQAFFVRILREADVELRPIAKWNVRLARDFCGAQPKCDACPLRTLLPARGPISIGTDE